MGSCRRVHVSVTGTDGEKIQCEPEPERESLKGELYNGPTEGRETWISHSHKNPLQLSFFFLVTIIYYI